MPTLVFFDRKRGIVRVSRYGGDGRLLEEQIFRNVKLVEFHGVSVRSFQGMEHSITAYVVEAPGDAQVKVEQQQGMLKVSLAGGEGS